MFVCSGSPLVAEALAHTGVDWLCLDTQHGAVGYGELLRLLQVRLVAGGWWLASGGEAGGLGWAAGGVALCGAGGIQRRRLPRVEAQSSRIGVWAELA